MEDYRLRVSDNTVLRRISGAKVEEATGDCITLSNKEPRNVTSTPHQISVLLGRSDQWGWERHVARMGAKINAYRVL
jgi:hypothetical protein